MSRPSSPWLVATQLTALRPDGSALLSDVTLSVANERVGLIGPNGSGKSTLLHCFSGERTPDGGTIERTGRIGVLTQRSTLPEDATVAHLLGVADVLAALSRCDAGLGSAEDVQCIGDRWDLADRVTDALTTFGLQHITPDRPLHDVSGGERTRLRLAAVLLDAPDLLLLDEPTNDLDATHRGAVHQLVRSWPRGLLVATHDRSLLGHVDRIVAIERGTVRSYGGNWDHYVEERDAQRLAAEREHASALASRDRVRREQQAARERQARRDASGRRARGDGGIPRIMLGMMKERSEGTGARLSGTAARANDEADVRVRDARDRLEEHATLTLPPARSGLASGTLVVALRDATVSVVDQTPLLSHVHLEVRGPERIALVGDNGSGKSTLLRVLAGQHPIDEQALYRGVPLTSV
ncbi:MAG TPA: ATP-binding cassette domain-containing protein, partial [Gemmatimonas sp.]|uniref:ATP-binding cassette domain-containing protein n=1 Tax=Gemmatimonas sp. TaxID=1962908 RepID=UPI002EDA0083